jgi:bis(5'-nucleosyl)-tetraphosphatase (symmetrical)
MATYFIGDIQACFDEFDLLLKQLNFNHQRDHLYLVGDLIGRGPQAEETLAFLVTHQASIHPVLGNHDLHFLAIANGIKAVKANDKYDELLQSPHLPKYINYLRNLPLIIHLPAHQIIVAHAGISPQWNMTTAFEQAHLVEKKLASKNYITLLAAMYNNDINDWENCHTVQDKAVFTINNLTRMRYCHLSGHLDFSVNCSPQHNDDINLTPWFSQTSSIMDGYRMVFGHWAALLGVTNDPRFIALDTGCLWGNWMTAWQLESNTYFQQISLQ